MVERCAAREPTRPRSALLAFALAGTAVVLTGCSAGSDDVAGACAAPRPAPKAETALLPAGLSFEGIGPVTRVLSSDDHLTVRAVTRKPLDQVTVLIQDAVTSVGYRPAGMDNEGFEAEVFFTAGTYAAGQAVVRQGRCEGEWDIELVLLDLESVPSPTRGTPT